MRFVLLTLIGLLLPGQALATYEWRQFPSDASQVALWQDGVQIGNLRLVDAKFFKLRGTSSWEGPVACPIGIPAAFLKAEKRKAKTSCCGCPCCGDECLCAAGKNCQKPDCHCVLDKKATVFIEKDGVENHGVNTRKISGGRHFLNGREVSRKQLMDAIEKPALPDDANLLFVTVIGPDSSREQVVKDLQSSEALAKFKGQYRLQSYSPDHWAVKDVGFFTGGNPTIYCQAPDGKVLHRQDGYVGAEDFAKVLEKVTGGLRDKNDSYDQSKDPDLRKKALDYLQSVPPYAWLIGGLVVLFVLLRKQQA